MASVDLKTSILVSRQIPEFVRDEYPTFVTFLEAYYEFLEGSANTGITSNNLVSTAKSLRDIRDVDLSLSAFETNFYNTYGSLIPLDIQTNKALLFKHLVPLYKTKGSDASFKLLFRLLFGVDIDVLLPKNNVLKASSSKWQIDNKLRINQDIASVYTGNGVTKSFTLAQIVGPDDVSVFINGALQTATFFINKEYRKLNFISAPANNSTIRVVYNNFNTNLLNNREVTGITSGASAIIEQANRRIISDTLNLGLPVELLINTKSLDGDFLNGESVTIPIINPDDPYGNTINIQASTFSIVKKFNVIDGGLNYEVIVGENDYSLKETLKPIQRNGTTGNNFKIDKGGMDKIQNYLSIYWPENLKIRTTIIVIVVKFKKNNGQIVQKLRLPLRRKIASFFSRTACRIESRYFS